MTTSQPASSKIDEAVDFMKDKWTTFSKEHSTALKVAWISLGVVVVVLWAAIIFNKKRQQLLLQSKLRRRTVRNVSRVAL